MQNNFSKTRYLALLFPFTQLSAPSHSSVFSFLQNADPYSPVPPHAKHSSTAPPSVQNASHHQSFSPTTQRLHLSGTTLLQLYICRRYSSLTHNSLSLSLTLSSSFPQPCRHLGFYHRVCCQVLPLSNFSFYFWQLIRVWGEFVEKYEFGFENICLYMAVF